MMIPEQVIRERSYFIWQKNGCPEGKSLEHWLQAKKELERELMQSGFPPTIFARDRSRDIVPQAQVSLPPSHIVADRIGRPKLDNGPRGHAVRR